MPRYRYSAGRMVRVVPHRLLTATLAVVQRVRGLVVRQFITRNRRLAAGLALVVVVIGVAAVHVSEFWFSPGVMILPLLAGALLLWPRALRILFCLVALALTYDALMGKAGAGIIATVAVTIPREPPVMRATLPSRESVTPDMDISLTGAGTPRKNSRLRAPSSELQASGSRLQAPSSKLQAKLQAA